MPGTVLPMMGSDVAPQTATRLLINSITNSNGYVRILRNPIEVVNCGIVQDHVTLFDPLQILD